MVCFSPSWLLCVGKLFNLFPTSAKKYTSERQTICHAHWLESIRFSREHTKQLDYKVKFAHNFHHLFLNGQICAKPCEH